MAKYHWICPKCKTSLELRQRVTLTKRRCPECGTSIKPEAIITETERADRERADRERTAREKDLASEYAARDPAKAAREAAALPFAREHFAREKVARGAAVRDPAEAAHQKAAHASEKDGPGKEALEDPGRSCYGPEWYRRETGERLGRQVQEMAVEEYKAPVKRRSRLWSGFFRKLKKIYKW